MPDDTDTSEQATLAEFETTQRCQAIATSTSDQCRIAAIPGTPYCIHHFDMLDDDETTG